MSILVNGNTRVIVQGITGKAGGRHARLMLAAGTDVVGGVTPGKGGREFDGLPVFDTMAEAISVTGADASVVFVPPPGAADAVLEAAEAGVRLVVCITDGVPVLDMIRLKRFLAGSGTVLVGPNCPGVISPGQALLGIMPAEAFTPGSVGVISRSGTLTYEVAQTLSDAGIGQSTCVGIGGDPVRGLGMTGCLRLFRDDPDTEAVVLIGEIGGTEEEDAADFISREFTKPVSALVAGATAPPGRRMGHAGAIISMGRGRAADKVRALAKAGVRVCSSFEDLPGVLKGGG